MESEPLPLTMYAREKEMGMKARDFAVPNTPATDGTPETHHADTLHLIMREERGNLEAHHVSLGSRQSTEEMCRRQTNTASEPER